MKIVFVAPAMEATNTGGNLYNFGLARALRARGVAVEVVALDGAEAALATAEPDAVVLVDSLYLEALPSLRRSGRALTLVAHYLPSLVARGMVPSPAELSEAERAALAAVDRVVAPSAFMARALATLGARGRVAVLEPAVELDGRQAVAPIGETLRAIVVANVVAGKGILPFVERLAPALVAGAPIALTILGDLQVDRAYASACRAAAPPSVRFTGARSHAATLDAIAESGLLVSPSRMESYGMALAEARALGIPIVGRRGGNAVAHIVSEAGGELVDDDAALAAACVRLARDRDELLRRWRAAQAARRSSRAWDDAAAELLNVFARASE